MKSSSPGSCQLQWSYKFTVTAELSAVVSTLRSAILEEIDFVLEKVGGIIAQCGKHAATSYGACEVHIEMLLSVVQEVYETVRQCEFEMLLANHLNDVEYPKALRRTLKGELSDRIVDTLWRLSTELLKLQLTVLDADEGNAVPKSDQVSRMAVAAAVADFAQKEKSKRGGLFSFWRK